MLNNFDNMDSVIALAGKMAEMFGAITGALEAVAIEGES